MGQVAMTRRWPATTGTIEQAGVESQRVRDGGRRRSRADAVIHYSYTVDGKDYEGERIWPGFASMLSMDGIARAFYDESRWQPGMQVPVYYNPKDPSRAVLDRSFSPVEKSF